MDAPVEKEVPDPPITYTLKHLKRPRVDTEKQPYLLGSDNVLYTHLEDGTAGEVVGERIRSKTTGKMAIRFHSKKGGHKRESSA